MVHLLYQWFGGGLGLSNGGGKDKKGKFSSSHVGVVSHVKKSEE